MAAGRTHYQVRVYSGGRLALDLDLPARPPQPGVPYPNLVVLPQWRTEQLLRDRLAALGGTVELGRELVDLHQDADGVTATVIDHDTGAGKEVRASSVVGCDGGGSRVRTLVGIPMRGGSHDEHFVLGDVRIGGLPADGSSFAWFDDDGYLAADPLDGEWDLAGAGQCPARRLRRPRDGVAGAVPAAVRRAGLRGSCDWPTPRGCPTSAPASPSSTATARHGCSWPATPPTCTAPPEGKA